MKCLKEYIICLNQSDWDYYFGTRVSIINNPFDNNDTSHGDFIEEYFKQSEKEIVLEFSDIKTIKADHTNSIFFLEFLFLKKPQLETKF